MSASDPHHDADALLGLHGQAAMEEVLVRVLGKSPARAAQEAAEMMQRRAMDPLTGESTLTVEEAQRWRERFDRAASDGAGPTVLEVFAQK